MSCTPDFSGIRAKLARAEEHRQTLERETARMRFGSDVPRHPRTGVPIPPEENRVPMRLEFEPDTGYHVFRVAAPISEESIRRWGIIAGDVVHNLRCALDHLVWQLALFNCNGQKPKWPKQVQFPISENPLPCPVPPTELASGKRGYLREVRPEHRAIIFEHQPHGRRYDYRGGGAMHPLLRLNAFSNDDKHRVIPTIAVETTGFSGFEAPFMADPDVEIVETIISTEPGHLLERDAEVMRIRVRPASFQLNMEVVGYLGPDVCFRDIVGDTGYRVPVYMELMNITLQVTAVIEEFEDIF